MGKSYFPAPETGLTAEQVESRKKAGRQNTEPERMTRTAGQIIKENIFTLFNLFNMLIAAALIAVQAWSNLLFIFIIALNTGIGIVQELRAKRMVEKLSLLSVPSAEAVRDGAIRTIPVQEIVLDDVLSLESGKQICSDSVVLSGRIEVNESLLTGESDPIEKGPGDKLFSGSFAVSGKCRARVVNVSGDNYAAQIAHEAKKARCAHSELLKSMRRVTRFTGFLIAPLGLLLFLQAFYFRGDPLSDSVISTSAGLLGMLPKGLVLLISISLAVGIGALSKKKVLVQELYALEALAHVDILCLDKTGTLTQGNMQVKEINLLGEMMLPDFEALMGSFLKNTDDNNATFLALKKRFGVNGQFTPASQIPFSSERKWSSMSFEGVGAFLLGAPERLCPGGIPDRFQKRIDAGNRVVFAGVTREPVDKDGPLPPVRLLAAITITDPIRPNAAETIRYFQQEGVQIKIISGDHPNAVSAVASKAGVPDADICIDMSGLDDTADFVSIAKNYTVFGRVSPRQKKSIVKALQQQGHHVAMTGDGVNDLLALREADCGIALSEGSDAARQISQLVLMDSDFARLPDVLGEGRRVVNNVTRVAGVFFVKTLYSIALSILCVMLNLPFPLIPIQVTLIDLVIEGYPAFFISFEKNNQKVTDGFFRTVLKKAVPNAVSIIACYFFVLTASARLGMPAEQENTLLYLLIGFVGIQAVWKACRPFNPLRLFLFTTMAAAFAVALALFRGLLHFEPPVSDTIALFVIFSIFSILIENFCGFLMERFTQKRTNAGIIPAFVNK